MAITLSGILAIAGMHGLGPLAGRVAHQAADAALRWHESLAWAMLALVAAHLLGVLGSSLAHRQNLVAVMILGHKPDAGDSAASVPPHRVLALAIVAAVGAALWIYLSEAAQAASRARPEAAAATVPAAWRRECESCHLPYAPCMLPAASWDRMLDEQAAHFGEDLSLGTDALAELRSVARLADPHEPWACWKTRASVAGGLAIQQITATPYWKSAHAELGGVAFKTPRVSGAHDCGACHRDAASSIFHPRMIHIPQ